MSDFATRRRVMVDTQVRPSDVTDYAIIDAMLSVPRENFVPRDKVEVAYADVAVDLGGGRVLCEVRLFAKVLEALNISNVDLVLDIGAGMGYSSAVIACFAEAVVAVEEDQALVSEAETLLAGQHADNVILHPGGLTDGAPEHGPYDAIVIEGGVQEIPAGLLDQLKDGGRIAAIFIENALGTAQIGYKIDGEINWRYAFNGYAPVLPGFEKAREFAL